MRPASAATRTQTSSSTPSSTRSTARRRWANADSTLFLRAAVSDVRAAGYAVGNVDATVICERPKLRPHIDAIRARLAEELGVPVSSVSVKAKTNEGMDAVGEGKGIAVHCVTLLLPISSDVRNI